MDLFELAVQLYIARDRGYFLSPQYLVGERSVWEACPDFLAINFPNAEVWMVEVTKAPGHKIHSKLTTFKDELQPRIERQLRSHLVISEDRNWTFGIWLFVPRKFEPKFAALQDPHLRVTSLEEAVFPIDDPYRP